MTDRQTPQNKAHELCAAIRDLNLSGMTPRVWATPDGDMARVYTMRGEYIQIDHDLTITTSRLNMAWGHILRDLIAA